MDAFFKFSRGGLDERRETKNLRGVYPRQIYYPDDPIYNDAQQDFPPNPNTFPPATSKKNSGYIPLRETSSPSSKLKSPTPHRRLAGGPHVFFASCLLLPPRVIPWIPSDRDP